MAHLGGIAPFPLEATDGGGCHGVAAGNNVQIQVRMRNTFIEVVCNEDEGSDNDHSRRSSPTRSPTSRRNASCPPSPTRKPRHPGREDSVEMHLADDNGSQKTEPTSYGSSRHGSVGSNEAWQEMFYKHSGDAFGLNGVSAISAASGAHEESSSTDTTSLLSRDASKNSYDLEESTLNQDASAFVPVACQYQGPGAATWEPYGTNGMTLSTQPPMSGGMWMNGYSMYCFDATRCGMGGNANNIPAMPEPMPLQPAPFEGNHTAAPPVPVRMVPYGSANVIAPDSMSGAGSRRLTVNASRRVGRMPAREASPSDAPTPPQTIAVERDLIPRKENSQNSRAQHRQPATKEYAPGGGPKRTDYAKKPLASPAASPSQPVTTMMLRHIPCRKTQDEVMSHIDGKGFEGRYDFLYLPSDTRCGANLGYAFVNFLTPEDAERFKVEMDGYRFSGCGSAKACAVVPAHVQGLHQNLATFKRMEVTRSDRKPFFVVDSSRE
eukprot:TRINITY_DN120859_c0_g1_i1.p1 TRINITY_DN120859_c0_g1~~TRINITY_DN120859_c0_g1_i1.p1  ORF type:complete len:493 (-),score=65.67 TRINITY_DN120859_c0_g1_i1:96-1574(-)